MIRTHFLKKIAGSSLSGYQVDQFFDLVHSWIGEYLSWHKDCSTGNESELPTRVIDVGTEQQDPFLKISQGQKGCWVVLPYFVSIPISSYSP
jgi:hypothetical protein